MVNLSTVSSIQYPNLNVPVPMGKKKAKRERTAKIQALQQAIVENIGQKHFKGEMQKFACVFTGFLNVACCLGAAGAHAAVDNAMKKGKQEEIAGSSIALGGALVMVAWTLNKLLDNICKLDSSFDSNKSLIDDRNFHSFVIDRCRINASHHDIDTLKDLYYNELDRANGL